MIRLRIGFSAILLGFLFGSSALSYVPNAETKLTVFTNKHGEIISEGMRVLRPELAPARTKDGPRNEVVEADRLSGSARIISGGNIYGSVMVKAANLNSQAGRASLLQASEAFIKSRPELFSKDGFTYDVNVNSVHMSNSEQFVSFDVYFNGIKVEDAHIELRYKFGKLIQVQNNSFIEANTKNLARADIADLQGILINEFGLSKAKFVRELFRVVASKETGYQLVRVSEFSFEANEIPYLIQIEHATGEIFQYQSKYLFATGHAETAVYPRSWLNDLEIQPAPFLSFKVGNMTINAQADGSFSYNGNTAPIMSGFANKHVKVNVSTGTLFKMTGVATETENEFTLSFQPNPETDKKADKEMAQAMVFNHVNRIIKYASNFINPTWFSRQLPAYVNVNAVCNAMWNGSSISFYNAGSNCANTALSADVIYHEWGHGLDANTGGIADGAFSEGYGDTMSLLMSGDHLLGQGFRANGSGIRDLSPDKVYPRDVTGQVHADGLIIGSTFYDLFTDLKAQYGDEEGSLLLAKYAFKVIYTARRYTDVYNALLVIDDDNANLADGTPNFCLINRNFAAHGLATKSEACEI